LVCPSGGWRTGRSNSFDEGEEDIALLFQQDHLDVNGGDTPGDNRTHPSAQNARAATEPKIPANLVTISVAQEEIRG
jgi:hypothetical protein